MIKKAISKEVALATSTQLLATYNVMTEYNRLLLDHMIDLMNIEIEHNDRNGRVKGLAFAIDLMKDHVKRTQKLVEEYKAKVEESKV